MEKFFLHIFDLFQKRKSLCFWLLTGIVFILLVMMASMKYNENIYDFLPVSGNEQKAIVRATKRRSRMPSIRSLF